MWTGLIFFSSTSAASEWCESAFRWIYAGLFGSRQDSGDTPLHFLAEKSVHLTLFCVLGILLWRVYASLARGRRFALVAFTGLVIGSLSEYLQSFFPGRDPSLRDVLINLTGTAIGAGIALCRYS